MIVNGLWIPLITPFYHGKFDTHSLKNLIRKTENFADGFVVGLSSGEGEKLTDQNWKNAIKCTVSNTKKPVAAGILGKRLLNPHRSIKTAKKLGCNFAVIPTTGSNDKEIADFFVEINRKTVLPIIVYNTEKNPLASIQTLKKIAMLKNIVAIKDSSGNNDFIKQALIYLKKLDILYLQGLENKLLRSKGCAGYLISLANLEPKLCKKMLANPTIKNNEKIIAKFWKYNLGGEWFVTIKALLHSQGIIRSAEQVEQSTKL